MMEILNYFKDTKGEMKHVSWPSQKQTIAFTLIVIALSLLTAAFLGFFDFIFAKILAFII
ncbi:MAG: preprotein translocase subunit SecE [Parcubacteria group bacterium]|nr:preprotein translocase subunit SecE [Parcubacteria group bacterium]